MACPSNDNPLNALVGFFKFLGDPIGAIVKGIASLVLGAAIEAYRSLANAVPTLAGVETSKSIATQTNWLVVYLAVGSILFAAIRMAFERRGDAGQTALRGVLRLLFVAGGATTVAGAAARLADSYSDHLFQVAVQNQLDSIACSATDGVPAFLILILAFLLLVGAVIQTILMFIRLGVLILLLGTLPLAAAASMTDWGGGWWRKHTGWLIAWLLYKPAVALIIYAGTKMLTASGATDQVQQKIAGIGVLFLSTIALPALLKLVVPATAALGGEQAYGQGVRAVAGGIASGAKQAGGSAMDSFSGGSGGSAPSGSSRASSAPGGSGSSGAAGGSGAGGMSGAAKQAGAAGGAAAAAGPAGAVVGAVSRGVKAAGEAAAGAVGGADGDWGHNR
ncbi:hypothetical protein [Streptomyces sp. NPDC051776]|uniref:hypothetical protein n=1 Tax=Streptomyces sp. NPDC051776 TaxID=3155414 RepID=UPI003447CABB